MPQSSIPFSLCHVNVATSIMPEKPISMRAQCVRYGDNVIPEGGVALNTSVFGSWDSREQKVKVKYRELDSQLDVA